MDFEDFLRQQKECSQNCGTVDIEHCCECAFKLAKQPEWNEGQMPEEPVVAKVVTEDGRYVYQTFTEADNAPTEPVKGWWPIPRLG